MKTINLKLEDEYVEPFNAYQTDPSPLNATSLLTSLNPAINRGIRAHVGKNVSPTTRSHARKLTLAAVRTYDPSRSGLRTHVINHLQGLRRIQRHQTQILKTPERVSLDKAYLDQEENRLMDQSGSEPTLQELADATGLSLKRIHYVRSYRPAVPYSMLDAQTGPGGETMGYAPAVQQPDSGAWIEVVYGDLNPVNQKIMEWTLGMHNRPVLSNQQIAAKLNLSAGAISQRKASIQEQINQDTDLSPFR